MTVIAWKSRHGNGKVIEAAWNNWMAAHAEAEGSRDFAKHEKARKAYSQYLRMVADADELANAIELCGSHHTLHTDGTILHIVEDAKAVPHNPLVIAREQAVVIVARGDARWRWLLAD